MTQSTATLQNAHPLADSLVEPGEAYRRLTGLPSTSPTPAEKFDIVVIGGGQAGLSVGYYLAKTGLRFLILDADDRTGDAWRRRWDSLRLFTPARYDSLVGMPFPAPPNSFPTKDEFADYLEAYAKKFDLPVRNKARVNRLTRANGRFHVETANGTFDAGKVIIAMSSYQVGKRPSFACELDARLCQVDSPNYQRPSQLNPGRVLIVGAGNSGAEIAMELSRTHRVSMAGRDTGHLPFRHGGFWARFIMMRLILRLVFHYLLTIRTPLGRKMRAKMQHHGGPLIRVKPPELKEAGVERVTKVVGARDGLPLLEDGRTLSVNNVIWCTGYRENFSFIDLPVFDDHGAVRHEGGVASDVPGLYFVGLHFLYSMSSTMIHGVGRDAARIVNMAQRQSR